MKFKDLLNRLDACNSATKWASDNPIERVVQTCHRGDWLLWIAKKIDLPLQELTLAKALCAKTVIHLIKDERSINAVNVAERFGRGLATRNELDTAAASAAAARTKSQLETANICREILGQLIINRVNELCQTI
jgi:hypothetical protein